MKIRIYLFDTEENTKLDITDYVIVSSIRVSDEGKIDRFVIEADLGIQSGEMVYIGDNSIYDLFKNASKAELQKNITRNYLDRTGRN